MCDELRADKLQASKLGPDKMRAEGCEVRVKGFVLAGGASSRMGVDKALLAFRGRPMIAIALETLRGVCTEVAISGNREDLAGWAQVVMESRRGAGPAGGIEAALIDATLMEAGQEWVLMMPVDLPLMSAELLRRWVAAVLARGDVRASYMECAGEWHPALCLVHRECLPMVREALDAGDRKLTQIFSRLCERLLVIDASTLAGAGATEMGLGQDVELLFRNVNTPEELAAAEMLAAAMDNV